MVNFQPLPPERDDQGARFAAAGLLEWVTLEKAREM